MVSKVLNENDLIALLESAQKSKRAKEEVAEVVGCEDTMINDYIGELVDDGNSELARQVFDFILNNRPVSCVFAATTADGVFDITEAKEREKIFVSFLPDRKDFRDYHAAADAATSGAVEDEEIIKSVLKEAYDAGAEEHEKSLVFSLAELAVSKNFAKTLRDTK